MTSKEKLNFIKEYCLFFVSSKLSNEKKEISKKWSEIAINRIPQKLFKYRECNADNLDALRNGKAWFSNPNKWNDPIDVTVLRNLRKEINYLNENFDIHVVDITYSVVNKYIETNCKQTKAIDYNDIKTIYYTIFKGKSNFSLDSIIVNLKPIVGYENARLIAIEMRETFSKVLNPRFKSDFEKSIAKLLKINELRSQMLMYSLSETYNNNHQWTIYADEGRGFCIGYDIAIRNDFDEYLICNLLPIHYGEKEEFNASKLLFEGAECYLEKENWTDFLIHESEKILVSFFTKKPEWQGEQEWRFFVMKSEVNSNLIDFDFAETIYLGENIEENHKIELIKIAKEKGLKVYQRKLNSTKSDFIYELTDI